MEERGAHGAVDALRELAAGYCVFRADGPAPGARPSPALVLAMAPASLLDECAHEDALDFMFADEMKVVRQLHAQVVIGRELVTDIYYSRGCARAIPAAAADVEDAAVDTEYYRAIYDILYPQIVKIKRLSDYCSQTVLLLSDAIQRLTVHENAARTIPDALIDALLEVLDVMMQLSHLHNAKTSLRNDFSVYKRIYLNVKDRNEDAERLERDMARLQEFVGSSNQPKGSIWASLQRNLANIKRFDQVAFLLLKRCVNLLENNVCMLPGARFKHIRLAALLKILLEDLEKVTKGKTAGIDRKLVETAAKLGSRYPIVPVFAELRSTLPTAAISTMRNNNSGEQMGASMGKTYDICTTSRDIRASCEEYLSKLLFLVNLPSQAKATQTNDSLFKVLVDGIDRMSEWKTNFLLFLAYKQQSVESFSDLQPSEDTESSLDRYERAIGQTISEEEWLCMIQVIHCIKSVAQAMRQFFVQLVGCARRHIYSRIQGFVQCDLLPILHRSDKRNLTCTKLLHDLRLCCGDWENSALLVDDFKKRRKERKLPQAPNKTVGISQSQLQLIRTIVDAIYSKRSMAEMNSKNSSTSSIFSFKRELDSADTEMLCRFYHDSAAFPSVLALEGTLTELQDFSVLWFRELQLELTQAIQFPTAASLPWLLVEHGLSLITQFDIEPVLSVLGAYNDAAHLALFKLKKRFLYDEVIAEGKMCYDFLVHHIAEQLYSQEKSVAASSFDPERLGHPRTSGALGSASLTHRIVNVFGAEQRFSAQVATNVNARVRKDLATWMKTLERSDITRVAAMECQLKVYQEAHRQLHYLDLAAFEDMLDEVSGQHLPNSSTLLPISSRVHTYVACALLSRLCQRFSVNFRRCLFIQSLENPALMLESDNDEDFELVGRAKSSESGSRDDLNCDQRAFFGTHHIEAISAMLRPSQVLQLADDCIEFIISKIEDVLSLCIPALGSAIPPYRLPRFMYRAEGCFGFFEGKFKHMLDSDELEAQILHCFREIGNAFMLLLLIDEQLHTDENANEPAAGEGAKGIFHRALKRVRDALMDSGIADEWQAPIDSCPETLTNPSAFYHVWSAIEFISCCRPQGCLSTSPTANRDLFGDGLQLAGCVLIHLLGQRTLYELWNVSQHVLDARRCDQARAFGSDSGIDWRGTGTISSKPATTAGIMATHALWKKAKATARASNDSYATSSVGSLDQEMKEKASAFLTSATAMRDASARMFHMLERFWPTQSRGSAGAAAAGDPVPFSPPAFLPPALDTSS